MADAVDSKSTAFNGREGSTPSSGIKFHRQDEQAIVQQGPTETNEISDKTPRQDVAAEPWALMAPDFAGDFGGRHAQLLTSLALSVKVLRMARLARSMVPGQPHHLTQRGNHWLQQQQAFWS